MAERQTLCQACGGALVSETSKRLQLGPRCARLFPTDVESYLREVTVEAPLFMPVQDNSDSTDSLQVPRKVYDHSDFCREHGKVSQPAVSSRARTLTQGGLKMLDFVLRTQDAPRGFFSYVMGTMSESVVTAAADAMKMDEVFDVRWRELTQAWSKNRDGVPLVDVATDFRQALARWRDRTPEHQPRTKASVKKRKLAAH